MSAALSGPVSGPVEFYLFTTDPDFARTAIAAGVNGLVIDWERAGKRTRQEAADTEINEDTVEDLERVRRATSTRILCRINPVGAATDGEIEAAVAAGANELLLPMVRTPDEVEHALACARGRVGVGILVETVEAVARASELACLPLARACVGLNDLAIERKSPSIFTAVRDGTLERIRRSFDVPFGALGMTLPELGDPIPCRLLVGELLRLRCAFTFLRRSFRRDVAGRDLDREVSRMHAATTAATARSREEVERDRKELEWRIAELQSAAIPELPRADA